MESRQLDMGMWSVGLKIQCWASSDCVYWPIPGKGESERRNQSRQNPRTCQHMEVRSMAGMHSSSGPGWHIVGAQQVFVAE